MTSVVLCPLYNGVALQDNNGNPLSAGQLFTYQAGSFTVPQATYTDNTGNTLNANPIILSSTGRLPHELWLDSTLSYNLVLTLSDGSTIIETTDNVSASSVTGNIVTSLTAGPGITLSSSTGNVTISTGTGGWSTGTTPLYISGTSFSVLGNQTTIYSVDLRIQATVTAGTVYGTILTSTYSGITGVTTVTLQMDDSELLDSGLSVVQHSIVSAKSTPPSSAMIITGINNAGTYYPVLATNTSSNPQPYVIDPDGALTYNPATDILSGNFSGNTTTQAVTDSSTLLASTAFAQSMNIHAGGIQVFSTPGSFTWTKPSWCSNNYTVRVQCWGPGGGGSTSANPAAGGGGGYYTLDLQASAVSANVTVIVGAGGVAGNPGTVGNASTFGNLVSAYGGGGGGNAQGGAGGGSVSAGQTAGAPSIGGAGYYAAQVAGQGENAPGLDCGANAGSNSGNSGGNGQWGGGGACFWSTGTPGSSVWGGGAGGSASGGHGNSIYAGAGGAAGAAGSSPSGGGGTGHNGGNGQVIVSII